MTRFVSSHLFSLPSLVLLVGALGCSPITLPEEEIEDGIVDVSCNNYCTEIMQFCASPKHEQYRNEKHCLDYCNEHANLKQGEMVLRPNEPAMGKNTIACRQYHAGVASGNPDLHCPHAGPTGDNVCGMICANYCDLMAQNCSETFDNRLECLTDCREIAQTGTGQPDDKTGDTIQCRIVHAGAAGAEENTRLHSCLSAAPNSDVCF